MLDPRMMQMAGASMSVGGVGGMGGAGMQGMMPLGQAYMPQYLVSMMCNRSPGLYSSVICRFSYLPANHY